MKFIGFVQKGKNPKETSVKIHLLKQRLNKFGRMIITTSQVVSFAWKLKGDLYHFHDPELLPWAVLLSWRNKKIIYDVHESVPADILNKQYLNPAFRKFLSLAVGFLEMFASKRMSAIVCATSYISYRFLAKSKNVIVINNYPRVEELSATTVLNTPKENAVLYVGDITYARGILQIMDAVALMPDVRLELAGNFSDKNIEAEIRNHAAWPQTNYHGFIDQKKYSQLLSTCKIGFVLFLPEPNHINAQPNKLFEYMSAGLPVIASHFPLWKEIIETPNTGICVDPLNKIAVMDAMKTVLSDENLASTMSSNGVKAIRNHYNWKNEEQKLLKLYENLLSN